MNREHDESGLPEVAALSREVVPDNGLEDRTVRALTRARLLRSARARPAWLTVAAAIVLFAMGLTVGRAMPRPAAPAPGTDAPRFLLLLHGGPAGLGAEEEARVAAEYGAWAVGLREDGRFVSGERLGDEAAVVPAGHEDADGVRGFFMISASSFDEAVQVARSCPHARRGGRIVVRPIDPT